MYCTIRKGLTGLLAGSMLFLSGLPEPGGRRTKTRSYRRRRMRDGKFRPFRRAETFRNSGFGTSSETDANTRTDSTAAFPRRRFVPRYRAGPPPGNSLVRPIRSSRATIWPGSRSTCRWPPTCATRSASSPDRVPTGYTEAPIRESGSPTTVSKTGRSWARPWHSIFSKGRASRG